MRRYKKAEAYCYRRKVRDGEGSIANTRGARTPAGRQCAPQSFLMFLVAKETAAADDLGDLRWHHLVPGFVSGGNALEHVA
jgi:hypothetical protein